MDSEGVYTLSKYHAPSGQWWVVEKILTPVNISAHPESYPVIYNIQYPIDGQQIFEIDRLLYTYDGGTGNWVGVMNSAELWEDQINDQNLKPCMQTILASIKNLSQGSVGQIIQKLSGEAPGYNWELKDGTNPQNTPGETNPPGLYNKSTKTISSTFDSQSWSEATDLSWARTIRQAKQLGQNQEFINKMNDLKTKTNLNYETGQLMKKNADGTYSFNEINGTPNAAGIDFDVPSPIDGYLHTHYTGLLSIFSPFDIQALGELYNSNLMADPLTFTAGVVTASGTSYILTIENTAQFNAFSEEYLESESSFNTFNFLYLQLYNITTSNTVDSNERGFLQLLKYTNSGLKLLKADPNSFSNWSLKVLDENNNVSTTNCN